MRFFGYSDTFADSAQYKVRTCVAMQTIILKIVAVRPHLLWSKRQASGLRCFMMVLAQACMPPQLQVNLDKSSLHRSTGETPLVHKQPLCCPAFVEHSGMNASQGSLQEKLAPAPCCLGRTLE